MRDEVATHESGHAVAFVRLFPTVEASAAYVTLNPPHVGKLPRPRRADYEKSAVECLAGWAAEVVHGFSMFHATLCSETDRKHAAKRTRRPLIVVQREAVELMQRPENRAAVEAVARELVKRPYRLSMAKVRRIVAASDASGGLRDKIVQL